MQDGQREVAGQSGEEDSDDQGAAENEQVRPRGANVVVEDPVAALPPAQVTTVTSGLVNGGYEREVFTSPLWDVSTDDSFGLGSPEVCCDLCLLARHWADD